MIQRLLKELRRRQVFGVIAIYVASAWVLIQVAESDAVQKMFRVDSQLVLLAAIVGLPFAIVAGWFYDITARGIFRTLPTWIDDTSDVSLRVQDLIAMSGLALVWGIVVYFVYVPPLPERTIAVLAFENRSHDPDTEIFAFGVRDDLNIHLGRVGQLTVVESTAVDAVGQSLSVNQIADRLNVAYLLKGTIERIADRIHVNVLLIKAADTTQTWSDSYDRELSTMDLFDIRREISNLIVSALRIELTAREQSGLDDRPTTVLAAWEAYHTGRSLLRKRTPESLKISIEEFNRAIAADPEFAAAHAELAIAMLLGVPPDDGSWEVYTQVIASHIESAMELDPELAEAYAAKGFFLDTQHEYRAALEQYERAVALNPNYFDVRIWMANAQGALGYHRQALMTQAEAVRLDPASLSLNYNYISGLVATGQFAKAEAQIDRLELFDKNSAALWRRIISSLGGNWSELVLAYLEGAVAGTDHLPFAGRLRQSFPWHLGSIGLVDEALRLADDKDPYLLNAFGSPDAAIALARKQLYQNPENSGSQIGLGTLLARAGKYAEARPLLEKWWDQIDGKISGYGQNTLVNAWALYFVRHEAGDEAGAREVVVALEENLRSMREAGFSVTEWGESVDYLDGLTQFLAGHKDKGLELISRAAADGFWIWPPAPYEAAMYDEPEFELILKRQEIRQARERNRVLEIVCQDNPYAAIWQPMNETCEQHLAAQTE